jgi:predicted RNase H-like HicB family nuclease
LKGIVRLAGVHSQGETLGELCSNLREAIELIMEDENPPELSVEFVGTRRIVVERCLRSRETEE